MPDNERVPMTKAQVTLYSAIGGFILMLVTLVSWANGVKATANEAKAGLDCLTPRVTAVEQHTEKLDTRGNERWDSIIKTFQQMRETDKEIQSDLKEILRRLPK